MTLAERYPVRELTGQRFGRLVALKFFRKQENRQMRARCETPTESKELIRQGKLTVNDAL